MVSSRYLLCYDLSISLFRRLTLSLYPLILLLYLRASNLAFLGDSSTGEFDVGMVSEITGLFRSSLNASSFFLASYDRKAHSRCLLF